MTIIQDANIRLQALDITQSFIVQAPAGSGKTELLTQRYLNLLAHANKAPEEIVAITFTRKAAAEMRARIIESLHFAKTPEPDKAHYKYQTWTLAKKVLLQDEKLTWQILENPSRLRILTIDALSALLCKQTPLQTQCGAKFIISDNSGLLYQRAAQRALSDILLQPPYDQPLKQLLLHLDNRVSYLEALFAELLAERDQWLPTILYCQQSQETLREILEENLQRIVSEKLLLAAKLMPEHLRQMITLCARHAGYYFQDNNPDHAITPCATFSWEEIPSNNKFQAWFGLSNLILTQTGELRKMIDIRSGFSPKDENKSLMLSILTELESHLDFVQALNDIRLCPPEKYTDQQWRALTALTQLLPALAATLQLVFQDEKEIDFTELNLNALNALGTDDAPTDLALYLDYQIQHLLIDEFQDTSITHLHLLEKIIAQWQPDDGRTLFLVGDPMQSIYRFRHAEVGLFLRAQTQGLGPVSLTPLTLTMNFRSQGALVNWFNEAFSIAFPPAVDIATGRVPYAKSIAARSETHFSVKTQAVFDNTEAEKIIETISTLRLENPDHSIAILVRSRNQLTPIISLLKKESIPFQAIDIESLFHRPEIQDLLTLTRALMHRADRIAWLSLLRAPFVGLLLKDLDSLASYHEDNTIWSSILELENIQPLSQDAKNRLIHLRNIITSAYASQSEHSLSMWIEGIWLALLGPATCEYPTLARAYFDVLSSFNFSTPLSSIIERCQYLFANTPATDKNPVQLMTIHKSKGLEFDHVFLPGLDRQTPADSQKLLRFCDRPSLFGSDDLLMAPIASGKHLSDPVYDYLKILESEKQYYENTRLLYVAATRAKQSLYLSFQLQWDEKTQTPKPPRKGTFLEKLWALYENNVFIRISENTDKNNNSTPEPLFSRIKHISNTLDYCYIKPIVTIAFDNEDFSARILGTVAHEALQSLSEQNPMSEKQIRARLLSQGLLPEKLNETTDIIQHLLTQFQMDPKGQWILQNHAQAQNEWKLTTIINEKLEHKIIDRTFIDEEGTRWIIDYKTSMPSANETLEDFLAHEKSNYRTQLESYAGLFNDENVKLGLYFPLCGGWIAWEADKIFARSQ